MTLRLGSKGRLSVLSIPILLVIGLGLSPAAPAWAAGDPSLDRLIVANPVPGWEPLPSSLLQSLVSFEDKTVSGVSNETVTTAAEGWQGADNKQRLIVALIGFPRPIPFAVRNVREAVISACATSTGNPPVSPVHAFVPIKGSQEAECSGENIDGQTISGTSLSWVKGDVIVFFEGVGLPQAQVETIALHQDAVLPTMRIPGNSSHTPLVIGVIGAAAVVVFLVVLLTVLHSQRRRRARDLLSRQWNVHSTNPPPAQLYGAAPGWRPDPSGRHEQRYWSGTLWTEHVYTNGRTGVDPLSDSTSFGDDRP